VLQERWPPWKAGLYGSEVVSLQGRCFQTGGLVYDTGIGGGILLMLAGVDLFTDLLLQFVSGMILGVSLSKIFCLRDLSFLSAINESHLD